VTPPAAVSADFCLFFSDLLKTETGEEHRKLLGVEISENSEI